MTVDSATYVLEMAGSANMIECRCLAVRGVGTVTEDYKRLPSTAGGGSFGIRDKRYSGKSLSYLAVFSIFKMSVRMFSTVVMSPLDTVGAYSDGNKDSFLAQT